MAFQRLNSWKKENWGIFLGICSGQGLVCEIKIFEGLFWKI
jgi:hypothetical protein